MGAAEVEALGALVAGGEQVAAEVVTGIREFISLLHPGLSDADLDAAVDAVVADATRRGAESARMAGDAGTDTPDTPDAPTGDGATEG